MKHVKFRAWDIKKNIWVTDFLIDPENGDLLCKDYLELNLIDELNLVQFIGIKDITGVEICEGDIITYYDADYDKFITSVLEFNDLSDVPDWIMWRDKKVIGNIYENPELMT